MLYVTAGRMRALIATVLSGLCLTACGGGDDNGGTSPPPPTTYTIGGTVTGLAGSGLVLQNNGGNNLSVTANGTFTFTTAVSSGAAYAVTVLTQPSSPAQVCAVASDTGTASANVTNVTITCKTTYTIGGTISGLTGTVVLQNNGGDNRSVAANGSFVFATPVASGSAYAVTVLSQPAGPAQTCSITNGAGTVAQSNVTNVTIVCASVMTTTRALHTATLLANGQILITGGIVDGSLTALDTAELYDPVANTFTALTNKMTSPRNQHTATLLPNGKVLIAGGSNNGDGDGMDTAELYDPTAQTFTAIANKMAHHRGGHTATLLAGGKVLLAGGFYNGPPDASAELYDPATNSFTLITANMSTAREVYAATLLSDGKVLLTGGSTTGAPFDSGEIYDPVASIFTALTATMTTTRGGHTATTLSTGQVIITGGVNQAYSPTNVAPLISTEVYDPVANTFTALPFILSTARAGHTATLLPSGKLLLIGGVTGTGGPITVLDTVETYGP